MKERTMKIPLKNYITLIAVFIIGLFSYSYVVRICKINKIVNSSILNTLISTISINDLDDFIVENPDVLLYVPSYKENNEKFEKTLFDYVLDNHLEQKVFYLNVGNLSNAQVNRHVYDKYANEELKEDLKEIPNISNILYFNNSLIVNVLYYSEETYDNSKIKEFIETKSEELLND